MHDPAREAAGCMTDSTIGNLGRRCPAAAWNKLRPGGQISDRRATKEHADGQW